MSSFRIRTVLPILTIAIRRVGDESSITPDVPGSFGFILSVSEGCLRNRLLHFPVSAQRCFNRRPPRCCGRITVHGDLIRVSEAPPLFSLFFAGINHHPQRPNLGLDRPLRSGPTAPPSEPAAEFSPMQNVPAPALRVFFTLSACLHTNQLGLLIFPVPLVCRRPRPSFPGPSSP